MKTIVFSIVLCLVIPSISVASYIIKLKNGRKISVQYYWKEGDNILFNIYGGVVGIQKDQVKEIEDLPDEKEGVAKQEAPETTQGTEETEIVVVQGTGTKKGEVEAKYDKSEEEFDKKGMPEKDSYDEESYKKKISVILELKDTLEKYKRSKEHGQKEMFLNEKRRIATEIESVSAAFREAKVKNDRKQMQVERKRLLSLQTELSKLRENVRADHGGQVPVWWDEPLP
ncbi:MAG: hypothetical protein H8D67_27110 [Deltaproteobacteria bacterium]|nr:hypothetical protein [Deltaproteobacteria bacterium]